MLWPDRLQLECHLTWAFIRSLEFLRQARLVIKRKTEKKTKAWERRKLRDGDRVNAPFVAGFILSFSMSLQIGASAEDELTKGIYLGHRIPKSIAFSSSAWVIYLGHPRTKANLKGLVQTDDQRTSTVRICSQKNKLGTQKSRKALLPIAWGVLAQLWKKWRTREDDIGNSKKQHEKGIHLQNKRVWKDVNIPIALIISCRNSTRDVDGLLSASNDS